MKTNRTLSILKIFQQNYPEYFMEAAELGLFMIVAGVATTILEYPLSPLYQAIPNSFVRLVLIGITMGATAIALIYSPWGKQSGAHFNPAVTLTFLRLGKMQKWDAIFYIVFQFIGGWIGLLLVARLIQLPFTRPPINYRTRQKLKVKRQKKEKENRFEAPKFIYGKQKNIFFLALRVSKKRRPLQIP